MTAEEKADSYTVSPPLKPYGEVKNFYARKGHEAPLLVFAGHTDVVPTGPEVEWSSPPFEPTIKNDRLYGPASLRDKTLIYPCEEFKCCVR